MVTELEGRTNKSCREALEVARRERADLGKEIEAKVQLYEQYGRAIFSLASVAGVELSPEEAKSLMSGWHKPKREPSKSQRG